MAKACVACGAEILPGDRRCRLCSRLTAELQWPAGVTLPGVAPVDPSSSTASQIPRQSTGSDQGATALTPTAPTPTTPVPTTPVSTTPVSTTPTTGTSPQTNCIDCGSTLLAGHRFCQICGKAVGSPADTGSPAVESAGTIDPGSMASARAPFRPSGPTPSVPAAGWTAPVAAPQRQPAYSPSQYRPAAQLPVHQPARKASSAARISALLAVLMALFVIWAIRTHTTKRGERLASGQEHDLAIARVEHDFGEDGAMAMVSMSPTLASPGTIITRTFPLRSGAAFSIDNHDGEIVIDSWDQQQVEISVIKYGMRPDGLPHGKIVFSGDDRDFKIRTAGAAGFRIGYHIKVPRALTNLEIKQITGSVNVSDVYANFSGGIESGLISLNNVGGGATLQVQLGDIIASFRQVERGKPLEFVVGRGQITLSFKALLDANLMARTENGFVSVDDYYGTSVKTRTFSNGIRGGGGAEASGQIGAGGTRLWARAQQGNIMILR
jgi:hypothetical protein